MRIAIVGAGALGSVIGGLAVEAGLDVVLIERNPAEVGVVREQGLWLEDLISWITGFHMSKRSLVRGCLRASHQADND